MPNIETEGQLIKLAIGEEWALLSPKIRARFESDPSPGTSKHYSGLMTEIRCSTLGRIMAFGARLIKAPLIPYCGENVPIEVSVYKNANSGDIHKDRTYYFSGRKPFRVHSYMRLSDAGVFQEFVNSWLGMNMRVYAQDNALYFEGLNYFIACGKWNIPLPLFLSPGKALIKHTDDTDDRFLVRIEMAHPWFGRTFLQEGVFQETYA